MGPGGVAARRTFLTVTLDSYGAVYEDGTPVDPSTYDYQRAALDAVHMPKLWDRFLKNLRRAAGYQAQYFACSAACPAGSGRNVPAGLRLSGPIKSATSLPDNYSARPAAPANQLIQARLSWARKITT